MMPTRTSILNMVRRRYLSTVSTLVLLLVVAVFMRPAGVFAIPEKPTVIPAEGFAPAMTGTFRLKVAVEGDLAARQNATVVSLCDWSTRVIWLIPEGTWVKQGDVICELDRSELMEYIQERELRFISAQAALTEAEQLLEVQKLVNESNIDKATLAADLASLDLKAYADAEYPRQVHSMQAQLANLEEVMTRADKTYEFTQNMAELGYRSYSDLETKRADAARARAQYEVARDQLKVLEKFTQQRQKLLLSGKAEDAIRHRSRVEKVAETALYSAKVRLSSRQRSYEIYRNYLDRLKRSLAACTIRAPQEGEVVYARTGSGPDDKVQEGSSAYLLRPLVHIPDRRHMDVNVRVHESLIRHLNVGQPATVQVAAAKGRTFTGKVSSVSTVPLPGRYPRYDLREYSVTITIDGESELIRELAPGLTAKVDIEAVRKADALTVPVQSVVQAGGRYVVFVHEGDDIVDREVQIGLANDKELEVLSGLENGEQVVIQPRLRCAEQIARLESLSPRDDSFWGD